MELVVIPLLGVILAPVVNVGSVFSTVTESEEETLSPSLSEMVAVQVISSVGFEFV